MQKEIEKIGEGEEGDKSKIQSRRRKSKEIHFQKP